MVKKISTTMILVAALLAISVAALAAGSYFGWFDFYSSNYGIQVSDTTQRIMNDSQKNEYTVGNVKFTLGEMYCDGYTALASVQVSLSEDASALVTGNDPYDAIGINGDSGIEYAKKLGVVPDTTWVDAAKELNMPLYLVRASLTLPEKLYASEAMEDAMISSDGKVTYFCMTPLNGKAYGETVSGKIEFSVRLFNDENSDDPSTLLREEHDIDFLLEAPIDTMAYAVPENTLIGNQFRLDAVQGVWMPGGLYIVSSFTALDNATEDQAYELLGEIIPIDESGNEYKLGLNLTGNIQSHENWPTVEMVRMTTLNEIPDTLILSIPERNGEGTTLVLELSK